MSLTLDTRNFKAAIRYSMTQPRKELPRELNFGARDVAIRAMKEIPRASKAKIAQVSDEQLKRRIIKRHRASGRPIGNMKAAIKRERARMRSSIGYTAAVGMDKAARAFGGRGVRRQKGFEKSEAAKGSGKKATEFNPEAVLVNTTPAGEKIGGPGLQKALDGAADRIKAKTTRRLGKIFQTVKG